MTRTSDQLALLRTETAPALLHELCELRELRTDLTTAISHGLDGARTGLLRVLDRD